MDAEQLGGTIIDSLAGLFALDGGKPGARGSRRR
jgi:hypothetical protein